MTHRKKALLAIIVTTAGLVAILYFVSRNTILHSYLELEDRLMQERAGAARGVLMTDMAGLDDLLHDWASWDDTIEFVNTRNKAYIESNISDSGFIDSRLSAVVIIDKAGKFALAQAFDREEEERVEFPDGLAKLLAPGLPLSTHPDETTSRKGIVVLPDTLLMVVSRPILNSDNRGPVHGTLVMTRAILDSDIETLGEAAGISIAAFRSDAADLPPCAARALEAAKSHPGGAQRFAMAAKIDEDEIVGYAVVPDIDGNPCLVMQVTSPRDVYHMGQATIHYFVAWLLVVGLVFGGLALFLVDGVLRELRRSEARQRDELEELVVERTAELESANERLRQAEKMRAIGELAGGVAHDFNNQLGAIMGYAELLCEELGDEGKLGRYAKIVHRSSRRASDLTSQLLAFARRGKFRMQPVDVHKVIGEVMLLLERSIDRRIVVRQELKAVKHVANGDPSQLQNAFLNMAINARDAMPDGGELVFATEMVSINEDEVQGHSDEMTPGRYIKVDIADTGIGMSKETVEHIFEPFFTTKGRGQGTGMGLAAVYGTIKAHQGAIAAYSEQGKGTTFRVYLPVVEAKHKTQKLAKPVVPEKGARILVVDDEPAMRELAADILSNLGHQVISKGDGAEAVAHYAAHWRDIDVVLLDLIMPEMSGRDAYFAMREANPEVRVIVCSGYAINDEAQEILDAGGGGFLQKPYEIAKLSAAVEAAFPAS